MNGSRLFGDWSSAQSVLAVPAIEDHSLYYLFTVAKEAEAHGLTYSVLDITKDNGMGAITLKNIPLLSPSTEQLCAIKHCNGRDIWVISHQWNTNAYYAYLVTPQGISTTPVISYSGRSAAPGVLNAIALMKGSPDGRKIAVSFNLNGADVSDFDNATGKISNSIDLQVPDNYYSKTYGVEFSPNSKLLYVTYYVISDILYQYDVSAGTAGAIVASKAKIAEINNPSQTFATIQTGPDGKLYMANAGGKYLSVISNPDVKGKGCNFKWEAIELIGYSSFGLPASIQTTIEPPFTITGECSEQKLAFEYELPPNVNSIKWDFGDPTTGAANYSTGSKALHEFSNEGSYDVKLIRFTNCGNDTTKRRVFAGKFSFTLGKDTSLCSNSGYTLEPEQTGNYKYLWHDNSANRTFTAEKTEMIWVELTNVENGCKARDTINVIINSIPEFSLGNDIKTCESEIELASNVPGATFVWSTGGTEQTHTFSQTGVYWLQVNSGQCFYRDTIGITFYEPPKVDLGPDTTLCDGSVLMLLAGNELSTIKWNNGSSAMQLKVSSPGQYFVEVSNNACSTRDTTNIKYLSPPSFTLGADKSICNGESTLLSSGLNDNYGFLWNDGSTAKTKSATQAGVYTLSVYNNCGTTEDAVYVNVTSCGLYVPNAFTPDNDGHNDRFKVSRTDRLLWFHMQIFNRWGQKVFESSDQDTGWDGTLSGQKCDAGSYNFLIQYKGNEKEPVMLKGSFVLIR